MRWFQIGFGALAATGLAMFLTFPALSDCSVCRTAEETAMASDGAVHAAPKEEADPATVTAAALKVLLDAKVPLVLLDARGEAAKEWVPGAVRVETAISADEAARLAPDKNALIVTYCGSPTCPLSHKLAARLRELGYRNILEFSGGIKGWKDAGYAAEKAPDAA